MRVILPLIDGQSHDAAVEHYLFHCDFGGKPIKITSDRSTTRLNAGSHGSVENIRRIEIAARRLL